MKKDFLFWLTVVVMPLIIVALISITIFIKVPAKKVAPVTYKTQEECEKTTGKSCGFMMCDLIPEGKTFEEVCGKDFREGWAPNN